MGAVKLISSWNHIHIGNFTLTNLLNIRYCTVQGKISTEKAFVV